MVAPPPPQLKGHTLVWVGFPDALRGLKRVKGVGEVYVRVRFVHQIIQHVHGLHDCHLLVGEASKLVALERREKSAILHVPQKGRQGRVILWVKGKEAPTLRVGIRSRKLLPSC